MYKQQRERILIRPAPLQMVQKKDMTVCLQCNRGAEGKLSGTFR